ncbi:HAD family hydrolase [Enterococcus sp. LJL90]
MAKLILFIFDMDGLMFETGRLAYRAYLKSAGEFDYEMTHNVYYYLTGKTEAAIFAGMKELYGEEQPTDSWREAMGHYKDQIFAAEQRVFKKKGLVELMEFAKEQQILLAVASSNTEEKIRTYLALEDVEKYVDFIITGDDVSQGKPDPEIFLAAVQRAGVEKKQAIIFEDSRAGIQAANNAGISVILVEDDITDLPVRKNGTPLIKDLSQFRESPTTADFQFTDLLAAKNFLAEKNLELN